MLDIINEWPCHHCHDMFRILKPPKIISEISLKLQFVSAFVKHNIQCSYLSNIIFWYKCYMLIYLYYMQYMKMSVMFILVYQVFVSLHQFKPIEW